MKITVKEDDTTHRFTLPTSLLLSRLSRNMIMSAVRKNKSNEAPGQPTLTKAQLKTIFRAVKHWKRQHGSWTVVEVKSASGEEITIDL